MLKLLADYAQEHRIALEPGFAPKRVRWAIDLAEDGRLLSVVPLGDVAARRNPGQEFPKCPELTFPELKAAGIHKSHFLVETANVVALVQDDADEKTRAKHKYFIWLHREASSAMPALAHIADLLEDPARLAELKDRLRARKARANDKVTFRVGGAYPLESEAWHDWWRQFRQDLAQQFELPRSGRGMRCFVTGELVQPALTHDLKISGLVDVGGVPSGSPLVGFNKPAFWSFGLQQSENAAVSEEDAAAYCAGLNYLIETHSQTLAGAKVVHWFKERIPEEDDPLPWLVEGGVRKELEADERARELLTAIHAGRRPDLAANYYYAFTLSGAKGRVMVRDWMEGQFEELVSNVHTWFNDLVIVARDGLAVAPSPKFLAVVGATVRELGDLAPPFVARMWRVAVRAEPIPHAALAQALARARVGVLEDEPPSHARMGLLKAYHLRKNRKEGGESMVENLKPYLNEEHPDPAYQCGRLMAVLGDVQRAALPSVGAGVVQRYYAAASSTPALILGRLARTSQFHLDKLSGGLAYWYENMIASIWSRLKDAVPTTLTLEQQSLFALGYYQQMAHMRAGKSKTDESKGEENDV